MPWRNFSRSSGVICFQRSCMRRRQCVEWPGRPRNPPSRIRLSTSTPSACQKVMARNPNRAGISQFHRLMVTRLKTAAASRANNANFRPRLIQFLFMLGSSCFRKFVVDGLEALPQMEHGVMLAREKCIDAQTGLGRQFLEGAALDFVGDEDLALLIGKLVQ